MWQAAWSKQDVVEGLAGHQNKPAKGLLQPHESPLSEGFSGTGESSAVRT